MKTIMIKASLERDGSGNMKKAEEAVTAVITVLRESGEAAVIQPEMMMPEKNMNGTGVYSVKKKLQLLLL